MAELKVKVSGGTTEVKIDDQAVSGLKQFNINLQGDNAGNDNCILNFVGAKVGVNLGSIVLGECEVDMVIPETLANLLKEQ